MRSFAAVVRAEAAPTIRVAMQPRGGGRDGGYGHEFDGGRHGGSGREGFGNRQGRGWGRAGWRQNPWRRKDDATPVNESKGAKEDRTKATNTQEQEQNQSNAKWEG